MEWGRLSNPHIIEEIFGVHFPSHSRFNEILSPPPPYTLGTWRGGRSWAS